jgi:MFS family permease
VPTPSHTRAIAVAAAVATCLAGLDLAVVSTAMPTVVGQLGGIDLYAWTFTAYLISSTASVLVYGRLADLYGRKRMFLVATGMFLLGSVLCGLSQSMPQLIAFRFVQGLGAGGVYPITLTIIGDAFPLDARARLMGLLAAIWGISALIGPAIGGFLAEQISWRWAFLVNLPLSVLAMVLIARFVQEQVAPRGGRLIPLELLNQRTISVGSINRLLVGIVLFGQTSFVPPLLQGVLGASPTQAGLALAATSIGWPLASHASGRLLLRWGYRGVGLVGSVCLVVGFGALLLIRPDTSLWLATLIQMVIGAGFGFVSPVTLLAMQNAVGWEQRGVVTGVSQFATNVGGTIGVAIAGALFSAGLRLDFTELLSPARRAALDAPQLEQLRTALSQALDPVYWLFVLAAVLATLVMTLQPPGPRASEVT